MTGRATPAAGHVASGNGTEPTPAGSEAERITTPRQRLVLQELGAFAYPLELRTLAAHVAAARDNAPVETVGDDACERTAIRLHHADIPALIEAGLVEYDPESRMTVRTEAHADDRYAGSGSDSVGRDAV